MASLDASGIASLADRLEAAHGVDTSDPVPAHPEDEEEDEDPMATAVS